LLLPCEKVQTVIFEKLSNAFDTQTGISTFIWTDILKIRKQNRGLSKRA